jgi:hypothetical protein
VISAQAQGGRLRVTVSDTGRGFGETVGAGVGLANIRERLAALYGETAKLTLEANAPNGVIATIEVPLEAAPPRPRRAGPRNPRPQTGRARCLHWARPSAPARPFRSPSSRWWSWRPSSGLLVRRVHGHAVQVGSEHSRPRWRAAGAAGIAIAFVAVVIVLAVVPPSSTGWASSFGARDLHPDHV